MTSLSGTNFNNGAAVGPQGEGKESLSTFPKYPEYKDSGVEWLGEVPEGWVLARGDAYLRSLAKVISADALGGKEVFHYSIPVVQATGDGQLEEGDEIDSSKILVEQSQVLISKLNPRKNTVCLACPRDVMTVCSGEFVPLQSDCLDLKWIYYLVSSENFRKRLESLVESATRSHQRVNPSDILKFRGAFPSLAEQTQIARFLDHETARIDALIEEQQRLIELLKEKRQAVISHAVTKGLDPTVPMKDSGVEWLGEVPAHWALRPLKCQCRFSGGGTPSKDNLEYWNGDIPWVSPKDMKRFWLSDTEDKITELAIQESSANLVKPGALLMVVRSGILQRTIPVAINTVPVTLNQDMKALIFEAEGTAEFVAFLISGFERSILQAWRKQGATVESIEHEYVANTMIPIPPKVELEHIVNAMREVDAKFDSLSSESAGLIRKLQERRSALISAAVTGKIDVRNWQPPAGQYSVGDTRNRTELEAV